MSTPEGSGGIDRPNRIVVDGQSLPKTTIPIRSSQSETKGEHQSVFCPEKSLVEATTSRPL